MMPKPIEPSPVRRGRAWAETTKGKSLDYLSDIPLRPVVYESREGPDIESTPQLMEVEFEFFAD
jgi:hypothetical protein